MWIVLPRRERCPALYWPGRRLLALIDALAWPAAFAALIVQAPFATELVGAVSLAFCLLYALRRARRAVWDNERYWFTTWRLTVMIACCVIFGWALELAL